jgi:tetratricopeptide (TPR) repeat protein
LSELWLDDYIIPAAELGEENPLPAFKDGNGDTNIPICEKVPTAYCKNIGRGTARRVLPYRMQDGYDRIKRQHSFKAIVLQNEYLTATFLPELGGRLVSLFHRPGGRELLAQNPVFQPANLALRNAWFSGGIEWNAGQPGHSCLTCSPVYAARIKGNDGSPILRIYEWDRVKCFPWQIDFCLPDGVPFLLARVRLINPHDHEIDMYWWTNMAVPEGEGVRVLTSAARALTKSDGYPLAMVDLPAPDGVDITYSTNNRYAGEYFYLLPQGHRPWIASVDPGGGGLFEVSTHRLQGRKLFYWGMSQGGRRWQEYLSQPGHDYIEIQAGLTRTQLECIPMPPNTEWAWTEAFGLLEADPKKLHSSNWEEARMAAGNAVDSLLSADELADYDKKLAQIAEQPPQEILSLGSGWGALERRRLEICKKDRIPEELVFPPITLGEDQAPWLHLLCNGVLPLRDPGSDPGEYMVQKEWRAILEDALEDGRGDHWLSYLHLGNMYMESHQTHAAKTAWMQSLSRCPSMWALRNLAVIEKRQGNNAKACALFRKAWEIGPRIAPLATEAAESILHEEGPDALKEFLADLPDTVMKHERIRILGAEAAIALEEFNHVENVLKDEFATVREGEITLTDLWFAVQENRLAAAESLPAGPHLRERVQRECIPPAFIDFRVSDMKEPQT